MSETVKSPSHIRKFHSEAASALNWLKGHFDYPTRATLILRNPDDDACDVFVSEDDMDAVEAMLSRTKEREKTAVKLV